MSAPRSASSKSFTSTPLKSKSVVPRSIPRSRSVELTGNSTYSLLSTIYHDSFELSDDDKEEAQKHCQSPDDLSLTAHEDALPISPNRNESPHADNTATGQLNLSAWEQWLVTKAKEERIKIHQKSMQEEIARREKEERERKERADEKFKEWLKNIKDKERHTRESSACSAGGYDNLNYPAPSFVNPIPWKPIHIPQHDRTLTKKSVHRKQPGPPKYRSTPCLTYTPKDTISFASKKRL
ncbi:hypothetical protein QTP86_028695 [Hemibagrus guttatus]|nr:hypothetical protein QTP86_028695 [Hemibagrus guttatus]